MSYTGIGFVNNNPPAINAENLNKMDNELVYLDGAVTSLGNTTDSLSDNAKYSNSEIADILKTVNDYIKGTALSVTWAQGYYTNEENPQFVSANNYFSTVPVAIDTDAYYLIRNKVGDTTHSVTYFDSNNNAIGWDLAGEGGNSLLPESLYFVKNTEATYISFTTRNTAQFSAIPTTHESKIEKKAGNDDLYKYTGNQQYTYNKAKVCYTNGDTTDFVMIDAATNTSCVIVDCLPGNKFRIAGRGGNAGRLWAFAKANGEILSRSAANITELNKIIEAPENAAKLVSNIVGDGSLYKNEFLVNRVSNLEDEISELDIDGIMNNLYSFEKGNAVTLTWQDGYYSNADVPEFVSASGYYSSDPVLIGESGAYIYTTTKVGNTTHTITLFDANQNPIGWDVIGEGGQSVNPEAVYKVKNKFAKYISFTTKSKTKSSVYEAIKIDKLITVMSNWLYGKRIGCLGDSLTYGQDMPESVWGQLIADRNGMTFFNYGINGSTVATYDGETIPSMVSRYNTMDANLDYITVMGGANDLNEQIPIGENTDNTEYTFKGALNILIDGLRQRYPAAHILFMTNFKRRGTAAEKTYVDAMKEICALKAIPCKDNYLDSGIDFTDANQRSAIEGVGLHFSAYGNLFISYEIEQFIRGH